MFEGTDLDHAYNMISTSLAPSPTNQQAPPQSHAQVQVQQRPQIQPSSTGARTASAPMGQIAIPLHDKPVQQPLVYHQAQQQQQYAPQSRIRMVPQNQSSPEQSYFESLISKRRNVLKMIGLSIIILLGISLHSLIDFVLREAVIANDYGFNQELGLRILYPVAVVLIMWSIKSFYSGRS